MASAGSAVSAELWLEPPALFFGQRTGLVPLTELCSGTFASFHLA